MEYVIFVGNVEAKEEMGIKKCEYHKTCKGYNVSDYICNDRYEPINYCGLWKKHEGDKYNQKHGLLNKLKRIIG